MSASTSNLLSADTQIALMQANSKTDTAKFSALKKMQSSDIDNLAKIEEKAKDFEAIFISEMMKPMFEGIETDGPFGGGQAEEMFRSLMLQEIGKAAAQTGQIGLSSQVKAELIRLQEQQSTAKTSALPALNDNQAQLGTKSATQNQQASFSTADNIVDLDVIEEQGL